MAQRAIELPEWVSLINGFETRSGFEFTIRGADEDEEDDQDGDDEDDSDDDDNDQDDDSDDGDDDSEGRRKTKRGSEDDDVEAMRRRMKAADKNAAKLAARLKEYEDKDKDENTKATERAEEAESKLKEQQSENASLRLQNAFLINNSVTWDDPEYALDYAQRKGYLDDVVDEDDGSIDSKELKKALKKLSEDKPNMVQRTSGEDEDEERQPSGGSVGGKRKKGKPEFDRAALAAKYPGAYR